MMINIYCDESGHLQYDDSDIMLMGGISCEKRLVSELSKSIRNLKRQYGFAENFEVKWTKVSPGKLDFYLALIDSFYELPIQFRCIVATGKKSLNHERFNQSYDEWYYKMYYTLLSKMVEYTESYSVYIDIKDTNGGKKVRKLQEILNKSANSVYGTGIQKVQIVKANEVELLQLCDLLMGCVGFSNRFITNEMNSKKIEMSYAKVKMCQYLQEKLEKSLNKTTPLSEAKFNIFIWEPRKEYDTVQTR